MKSYLVLHNILTGAEHVIFETDQLIEAPNWSPCGAFLVVNGDGHLYRFDLSERRLDQIDTGPHNACNNDHGISPDGSMLVISDSSERGQSCIYTLPIGGGRPQRVTADVPSYWHGWSPDGQTLAYVGKRDGDFNLFTIDRDGGKEKQLTFGAGHCDGPDYTPNGAWIWFNADHHGKLSDLWRIRPDGSELTQMTDDKWVNWFPHPSPDGNHILYLAYGPHVTGHPRGEQVSLKLMSPDGGSERIIAEFYGGQGSINVPNWSPDSTEFAYMRYAP